MTTTTPTDEIIFIEHELKTHPDPFQALIEGRKRHEVRRNDRDFQVHDTLYLREWDPTTEAYTGRACTCTITYITPGGRYGLPDSLCVLSVADVRTNKETSQPVHQDVLQLLRRLVDAVDQDIYTDDPAFQPHRDRINALIEEANQLLQP